MTGGEKKNDDANVDTDGKRNHVVKVKAGRVKLTGSVATVEVWGKPPEEHPIYAKIGRVASDWSHVEHILDLMIWELTGGNHHKLLACTTAQLMGPYSKLNAIVALLTANRIKDPSLRRSAKDLQTACINAQKDRNRIVHDAWYLSSGGEFAPFRAMPKDDLRFGIAKLGEDYFEKTLARIEECFNSASALRNDVLQVIASKGTKP